MKKAVVLFSGGLDSTTCLGIAKSQGFAPYALSFKYGQRHLSEIKFAKNITQNLNIPHKIFNLPVDQFGGSALTDMDLPVPNYQKDHTDIPITYVPARNTIFLSIALAWAEVLGAKDIFIGVSSIDYSMYPDCRPEFIRAFQTLANLSTKYGVENSEPSQGIKIHAPLINLTKAETILLGVKLGIDYQQTVSCYQLDEDGKACGVCDCCGLRKKGFHEANITDPTIYFRK